MSSDKRPCILWGATGQAKVIYDILRHEGSEIIHLFDNNSNIQSPIAGVPISYGMNGFYAFVENLWRSQKRPEDIDCIAAIGGDNGKAREILTEAMAKHGFKPRSVIHKSAIISATSRLGFNIQIMAGSLIGPFTSIGDFSIINSGASIDHDCIIGKSCHIGPRATLAGEVTVDDYSFVGANATILPRKHIFQESVVGAGSVVTKDVPAATVVAGNPAKPLVR